ncbi:MAG TPA: hemolysin D [Thermoanaerobaculia bacterium]|nr:hemolysin D [Thermoanaerobaculia bacterium]
MKRRFTKTIALAVAACLCAGPALPFTQGAGIRGTGGTPQGHEWLTVRSALEVLGDESGDSPSDPRTKNQLPRAENPNITPEMAAAFKRQTTGEKTYGARYQKVLDAVLGQRWVDIGGFNVVKAQSAKYNCFDMVPQLPDDIQRDHFMRMRGDAGGAGAVAAMNDGVARFVQYFVDAATAPEGQLKAWDGGGYSVKIEADRNYFLFGRAIHLFQDSFSADHTVRLPADGYRSLQGIKTYLCSLHSDQHSRNKPFAIDFNLDYAKVGDIIWLNRRNDWTPANVKLNALVAVEGMKDAWASFIRVMALPQAQRQGAARAEAERIARAWLSFDPEAVRQRYDDPDAAKKIEGFVSDQAACDNTIGGPGLMERIRNERAICLWNVQAVDGTTERDRHLHIPFRWDWKSSVSWKTPPPDWDPTKEN